MKVKTKTKLLSRGLTFLPMYSYLSSLRLSKLIRNRSLFVCTNTPEGQWKNFLVFPFCPFHSQVMSVLCLWLIMDEPRKDLWSIKPPVYSVVRQKQPSSILKVGC